MIYSAHIYYVTAVREANDDDDKWWYYKSSIILKQEVSDSDDTTDSKSIERDPFLEGTAKQLIKMKLKKFHGDDCDIAMLDILDIDVDCC